MKTRWFCSIILCLATSVSHAFASGSGSGAPRAFSHPVYVFDVAQGVDQMTLLADVSLPIDLVSNCALVQDGGLYVFAGYGDAQRTSPSHAIWRIHDDDGVVIAESLSDCPLPLGAASAVALGQSHLAVFPARVLDR